MLPSSGKQPQDGTNDQGTDQSGGNGALQGHSKGLTETVKDGGERLDQVEAHHRTTAAGATRSLLRMLGAAASTFTPTASRGLTTPPTQDGSQVSFGQEAKSCMGGGVHGGHNNVTFNSHTQHTHYQHTAQEQTPQSQFQGWDGADRGRGRPGGDSQQTGPEYEPPLCPSGPCQAY